MVAIIPTEDHIATVQINRHHAGIAIFNENTITTTTEVKSGKEPFRDFPLEAVAEYYDRVLEVLLEVVPEHAEVLYVAGDGETRREFVEHVNGCLPVRVEGVERVVP